jgi:YebC/PmpR family DNA-binding regulatory protein
MAGHSHYANILRRKTSVDAKRAKVWSKVAKKIMVAAKRGGDPSANLALRYVIDEAKGVNMPKDTIQKAIDKGSGAAGTDHFENISYEAYGPGGVAMIVEALSDNRTRTAGDLRSILDRAGGNLATSGAVSFVFSKRGVITIRSDQIDEEMLVELALEAGAEDVRTEADVFEVLTSPTDFLKVKESLEKSHIGLLDAQITHLPANTVSLDADQFARFNKLLDALDDNDDVQSVYHNAEPAG